MIYGVKQLNKFIIPAPPPTAAVHRLRQQNLPALLHVRVCIHRQEKKKNEKNTTFGFNQGGRSANYASALQCERALMEEENKKKPTFANANSSESEVSICQRFAVRDDNLFHLSRPILSLRRPECRLAFCNLTTRGQQVAHVGPPLKHSSTRRLIL